MKSSLYFDLQFFAEGDGGATGAAEGADQTTGAQAADAAQGSGATPDNASAANERAENYARFKTDYKAEYDADVQNIVQKRLANANRKIQEADAYRQNTQGILDALAAKYGVEGDPEAILKAVNDDDSLYEQAAYDKGMSVDTYKEFRRLELENRRYRQAAEEERQQQRTREIMSQWESQSEAVKQLYPDFQLEQELNDANFSKLLRSGVDVRTAFEICHRDEIIPAAMRIAAQKAAAGIANSVDANGRRPDENGLGGQQAVLTGTDPSKLTREQIADLKERARRGEVITFRG